MPDEIIAAISSETIEVAANIGEMALDSVLQEGVLRDIPILSTIASIYHMGSSIQNALFLRNIGTFLVELKIGRFKEKSIELMRKIGADENFRKKVSDIILILNTKFENTKKAKILAGVLLALAERNIDENDFDLLCGIINELTINDYNIISDIAVSPPMKYEDVITRNPFSLEMQFAGLQKMIWLGVFGIGPMTYENMDNIQKRIFSLTDIGRKLYEFGISRT